MRKYLRNYSKLYFLITSIMDILLPNKNRRLRDWSNISRIYVRYLIKTVKAPSQSSDYLRLPIQTWIFSQKLKQTKSTSFLQYFPKKTILNYIHNKNAESIYEKNENLVFFLIQHHDWGNWDNEIIAYCPEQSSCETPYYSGKLLVFVWFYGNIRSSLLTSLIFRSLFTHEIEKP